MTIDLLGFGNTDNAVTARPARSISRGAVDTWAQDCSSPDADDGTAVSADFTNDILAQVRTALRSSGIDLSGQPDDMLWRAMQSIGLRGADDTGAAGHLVAAFTPPVTTLAKYLTVLVQAGHDCPGATDMTANGTASKPVKWPDGSDLAPGDFKAGSILVLSYDGTNFQLIFKLNSGAAAPQFVPGCIYQWPLDTPPTGLFECDGAAVSRATYARLFAIIGTAYGVGNGTSTFNLPDLRGEFLRGWDHGRGVDADRAARTNRGDGTTGDHVGTKQAGAAGAVSITSASFEIDNPQVTYQHTSGDPGVDHTATMTDLAYPDATGSGLGTYDAAGGGSPIGLQSVRKLTGSGTVSGNSGSSETRPRNVNILYCIAY
jgi:microcystin-dependent protein